MPYSTFGASIEKRFRNSYQQRKGKFLPKSQKNSFKRLAGGLAFYNDKAGDGSMGTTQVNLTFAVFVPTSEKSALSFGLQGGIVQRTLNFSKLTFPDQYNGTGYDQGIASGESPASQNSIYPDISGGINWNYGYDGLPKGEKPELRAKVGASVFHINQPVQPFLIGDDKKLNAKIILHGDVIIGIKGTNMAIAPSYILMLQGPTHEMIEGVMLKYYLKAGPRYNGVKANSAFGLGISLRNKDAAIASILVEFGQFAFGCSYDLNISLLNNVSKVQGGPEVFLRFITPNPFSVSRGPSKRYHI